MSLETEITRILDRAQPGSRAAVRAHIKRGITMAEAIQQRWGVRPAGWKAKHLRWFLERGLADLSAATRYDYYRTARAIAAALGHWPAWEAHLRGPWESPKGKTAHRGAGGRPAKLAHRAGRG